MGKHRRNGKRYTEKERAYLRENYEDKTNEQLANHLRRPVDAVRKQLNFMGLRRSRKYEVNQIRKAITPEREIFKNLRAGGAQRKELQKNLKQIDKKIKFHGRPDKKIHEDESSNKKRTPLSEMVKIKVDDRTFIYSKKGKEAETLEKYRKHMEKKLKK